MANEELLNKYAAQAVTAGDSLGYTGLALHGAVAVVADAATSIWNTFAPEKYEASTEDLLSRVDKSALQVYQENPDTIQTISFVGGAIVPAGIALKGLSLLRNGSKAVNWFTEAGRVSRLQAVESAFANGGAGANAALNAAQMRYYGANAANMVTDAIAAEAAIVFTMSAHPYMEDYKKDFAQNFAMSVALGAGIGGAIGHIIARGEVKAAKASTEGIFTKIKTKLVQEPELFEPKGSQILRRQQNVDNIQAYLDENKDAFNHTLASLRLVQQSEKAKIIDITKDMLVGDLAKETNLELAAKLAKDPRFVGVDEVRYATKSDIEHISIAAIPAKMTEESKIFKTGVVYSPVFDAFVPKSRSSSVTTLADEGTSIKEMLKASKQYAGMAYRDEVVLKHQAIAAHAIERDFAEAFLGIHSRKSTNLELRVDIEDLPTLKAIANSIVLRQAAEEDLSTMKVILRKNGKSRATSLDKIVEASKLQTLLNVKEQAKLGLGMEEISIRTNMPYEEVQKVVAGSTSVAKYSKFDSVEAIEEAMKSDKRSLVMSSSPDTMLNIPPKVGVQQHILANTSAQVVEASILSSPSQFVRESIGKRMLSEESKHSMHFLKQELASLLPSQVRNSLLASSDMVVDRLGPVGQYLVAAGKRVTDTKNAAKESITRPISEALTAVAKKGDAAVIEINHTLNLLAAQRGFVIYRDRQLWAVPKPTLSYNEYILMEPRELIKVAEKVRTADGREFRVATDAVDTALHQLQSAGRELYELGNVSFKARGRGKFQDRGFWAPPLNPQGKQIAYAFHKTSGTTTMIVGQTSEELEARAEDFLKTIGDAKVEYDIVFKGKDLENYNKIAGRQELFTMTVADNSKLHSGASAQTTVPTTTQSLGELVQGYDYFIGRGIESIAQVQYAPVLAHLDDLSMLAQHKYSTAALNITQIGATRPKDAGFQMKNILMGRGALQEHDWWVNTQSGIQSVADMALSKLSNILSPFVGKGRRTAVDWAKVVQDMRMNGIVNPFPKYSVGEQAFIREGKMVETGQSPRVVALANGLAATVILRAADLTHAFVNLVSLPILSSSAINRQLAASYGGAELNKEAKFLVTKTMYDGIRFAHHPTEGLQGKWGKLAIDAGLFTEDWRTVNALLKEVRTLEPSMTSRMEELLDSKFVEFISTASDKSEQWVRQYSFFTGVSMAKKAYPGLDDGGVMVFARNFMNEAVGNYNANQRPAIFQGTLGTAMGLFQTYFVTLAQNIYRGIETKDWATLGKMLTAQSTIFGASSLPGFQPVSDMIGAHFSDNHIDLQTGTFRAIEDETANIILYGLPSQLVGITTRGDIQPRIPNPTNLDTLAMVQFTKQAYEGAERVIKAGFDADRNVGLAMLEALSLQSLSRPLARWSEFITEKSITKTGDIIAHDEEIWTWNSIFSRAMATRPLEEIKAREAIHLKHYYGTMDADSRRRTMFKLKAHIEEDSLSAETYSKLMEEYMRTGTPTGWRNAVRGAMLQSSQLGSQNVRDNLAPTSPLNMMIDDLD